jgi:hypothetical protein
MAEAASPKIIVANNVFFIFLKISPQK